MKVIFIVFLWVIDFNEILKGKLLEDLNSIENKKSSFIVNFKELDLFVRILDRYT